MLGAEILTQFVQNLHVLLHLLSLLVACELKLIDALEHVSLALLSRLELADVEGAAAERSLRGLNTSSLSILHSLEANESEAKDVCTALRVGLAAGRWSPGLHQLEVCHGAEGFEKLDKFNLSLLH